MNLKRKLKENLDIASGYDILIIIDAIMEREKYGQLSPETIKTFYDYHKKTNPNFKPISDAFK